MRSLKQIKVIGFPFAKSQMGLGAVNTPGWLMSKEWFQKLTDKPQQVGVTCEVVDVKPMPVQNLMSEVDGESEDKLSLEQMKVAIDNCERLQSHVAQALSDGYYPIVLGGDSCQTLGSAKAVMKTMPQTTTLWIDSMIDINQEGKHGFNVLELQTGMSAKSQTTFSQDQQFLLKQLRSQDLCKDIVFIGACNDKQSLASIDHIISKGGLVFKQDHCQARNVEQMYETIEKHAAFQAMQSNAKLSDAPFWISLNMNALDSEEFRSKTRGNLISETQPNGVSLDFLSEFMQEFTSRSVGLDLSDVNFEITSGTSQRHADEQTFRELFENVLSSINKPNKRADIFEFNHISHLNSRRSLDVELDD